MNFKHIKNYYMNVLDREIDRDDSRSTSHERSHERIVTLTFAPQICNFANDDFFPSSFEWRFDFV